jgi:hypothetical protein
MALNCMLKLAKKCIVQEQDMLNSKREESEKREREMYIILIYYAESRVFLQKKIFEVLVHVTKRIKNGRTKLPVTP